MEKANAYKGNKKFTEDDSLKVPNIKFNTKKEFEELCNKEYLMNKEYKEKILKTGLEGFLLGVAIGVAAGIFYFFTH